MPVETPAPPSPLAALLADSALLGVPNWIALSIALLLGFAGLLVLFGKVPLSYNLLNLKVRWRTTALTALAFTLVIGLLTGMLAFINGMWELTENSGQPGNVMVLAQGSTDEAFSDLGFSDVGDLENQKGILAGADGRPLVSRETYLVVTAPIEAPEPGRPKRRFLQLRGLDDPLRSAAVHGVGLKSDSEWFSDAGVREQSQGVASVECVLGDGIARELAKGRKDPLPGGRTSLSIGDSFSLNDRPWVVVGVMDSAGSVFDSEIWAKRSLIGPMFGKNSYSTLVVRTADEQAADALAKFLREDYGLAAVNAITEKAYFANLNEYTKALLYAIVFVTIVLAVGGVFGVMNTMFAAISQRTKDIGVLRLMGYARRHILASFLLEALAIGLIGGLIGCALGSLADGVTATSILAGQGGGGRTVVLELTVDAVVIAAGVLLTLLMALIGGVIPAINAMRLTALDALK